MSEVSDPDVLKQLNDPSTAPSSGDLTIPAVPDQMKMGEAMDIVKGMGQGLLDPFEGLAQLAEHIAHHKLAPDAIRQWAKDYRKQVQGTYLGVGGEVLGNVAGLAIPGGAIGRATSIGGRIAEGVGEGALSGALQPVTGGGDYWATKRRQAVEGGLAGGAGPVVVGPATNAAAMLAHPKSGLLHMFAHGGMPGTALGNLAQRAAPRKYGEAAGIYRGMNPYPASPDQEAAPQPPSDDTAPPAPAAPKSKPAPPAVADKPSPHDMPADADFSERMRAMIRRRDTEETE